MRRLTLLPGNPMGRVLASVLAFEVVMNGLAIFGLLFVSQLSLRAALLAAGGAALLALAALVALRRPGGFVLGWLAQLATVALGLLAPIMYAVGGVFALVWVMTFVLGRRIEAAGDRARVEP